MNYTQVSTGETLARKQVREVLRAHKGTMARMAAQLGVTRTAVWLVLKGKSKSRRILCACVGEAQRLLQQGQRLLEERHLARQSSAEFTPYVAETQSLLQDREGQRACSNCGEKGGEPETIRGEGWSEEVCSKCVGRRAHTQELPPGREAHSESSDRVEEGCPF